jgi:hypothetical protein
MRAGPAWQTGTCQFFMRTTMTTPETSPNPLFENLVPATPQTRIDTGKLTFADAMPRMGMSSVFDIIREPKQAFATRLRTLSDADGEMAYDNALCYASQIARSFREEQVSSGRDIASSQRSGVRALVDIGPSYPNLFQENWDEFCKVGAIEAMDGPVAYLGALRRFAAEKIEGNSTSPRRIPLAVRRPDLDQLVIDEQSTYRPIPMLDLVNDVLTQGIDKYQKEKGDERPVQQLLAEKKHPFVFPYHFAHQQVSLALSSDKPGLGKLNHALALLPAGNGTQPVDQHDTLLSMSGLSPTQQHLLIQPGLFASFNRSLGGNGGYSPILSNTHLWSSSRTYIDVPEQESVVGSSHLASYTLIEMRLAHSDQSIQLVKLRARRLQESIGGNAPLNEPYMDAAKGMCITLTYFAEDNADVELADGFAARLTLDVTVTADGATRIGRQISYDIHTGPDSEFGRPLDEAQTLFFREHYGIDQGSSGASELANVAFFYDKTGIDAQQLQTLLCQKDAHPKVSPHCPIANRTGGSNPLRRFPNPMNYGAVYINGNGAMDRFTHTDNRHQYNNAITLREEGAGASTRTYLAYTSLDRFDRLQRMIRLQRWTGLPFAELDTLIVAAMRAEGDANPALEPNRNTLRMLGAYRYFNREYGIGAEELAAFVHELTPFASGDNTPLLDRVFNTPVLFGTPLRLDNEAFTASGGDADAQKTVNQLCAGLGLEPGGNDFILAVTATQTHVGPLKRSLAIVSSLYRQARVARLFGMSISDCHYLLECLGGSAYVGKIATGMLAPRMPGEPAETDALDILMQLDALVRFLKTHKLRVTELRSLLDDGVVETLSPALIERLQQLANDGRECAVTPAKVQALRLPNSADGAAIDWHGELHPELIDTAGLVVAGQLSPGTSDRNPFSDRVDALIGRLNLDPDAVEATALTLTDFIEDAYVRQSRLMGAFMQEQSGFVPERALHVSAWSNGYPLSCLMQVMTTWPADASADPLAVEQVAQMLAQTRRHVRVVEWAGTGAQALSTFLACPHWLGGSPTLPIDLPTLYLLKAYDTLFNTLGKPEERLLGYLQQANAVISKRPGQRQRTVHAQTCNAALASLLGWSESEVGVLTAQLPQHTAKTVAHIDWVRRAQALALETGLNATSLLQACALNADSPEADWQAVGQAAMAAAQA